MKTFIKKHKPTVISYFIATLGILVVGSIGSNIIGQEYAPLVFTTGGVFLEKLAEKVRIKVINNVLKK